MKNEFYAHSREGKAPEEWHQLEDHLRKVAELARNFGSDFNAGDWVSGGIVARCGKVF